MNFNGNSWTFSRKFMDILKEIHGNLEEIHGNLEELHEI